MKIALDIRSLFYTDQWTGIEEYIYQLAYYLPHLAPQDQFILFYNSPCEKLSLEELRKPKNVQLVNWKKPNKLLNFSFILFQRPKLEKLLGIKPDIVIIPSYRPLATTAKKIMVFHDLGFVILPHLLSLKTRFWHQILGLKKQAQTSDHLIAVSQSTKNDLIHYFKIPAEKISVTLLGTNASNNTVDYNYNNEVRFSTQIEKPFIFTLGTKEPRKNINGIIKAFKKFKTETTLPHKLVIAGKGKCPQKDSDIIILDYISAKEKKYLYQNCEFFALPSFYEGFGLPVLEAMRMGTPVITSNISSLPEITADCAILVNPNNTQEITQAFKALAQNPRLRIKLSKKGQEQSKKFRWEKTAQETLKVLKMIADGG